MHPRTPKCVLFLTYTKLQSIYLFKGALTCQNLEKKQKKNDFSAASPQDTEMSKILIWCTSATKSAQACKQCLQESYGKVGKLWSWKKKSRIRETKHLSTDADSSTAAKKLLSIFCFIPPRRRRPLLFEALMKLVQLQWKSFLNKNLPSLMIYVHKNQCQLFHISNGII